MCVYVCVGVCVYVFLNTTYLYSRINIGWVWSHVSRFWSHDLTKPFERILDFGNLDDPP